MSLLLENWPYCAGVLAAGFILGLIGRKIWSAIEALMAFEYTQARAKEQAEYITREYSRVMSQTHETATLHQLHKRFSELELEVERLRRGLGQ